MADIRLVLADDDPVARKMFSRVIDRADGLELVGTAEDALSVVEVVVEARPDLVLLDNLMPGGGGPAAARRILERLPDVRVVALTGLDTSESWAEMREAGAHGFLPKVAPVDRFVATIKRIATA
jgi:DNA-binding NarL/FixJ family response regulator